MDSSSLLADHGYTMSACGLIRARGRFKIALGGEPAVRCRRCFRGEDAAHNCETFAPDGCWLLVDGEEA